MMISEPEMNATDDVAAVVVKSVINEADKVTEGLEAFPAQVKELSDIQSDEENGETI